MKLKGSGVVSSTVRTVHASLTPPTVTVAVEAVLAVAALVRRTCRVWLFRMAPLVAQAPPLILIRGSPSPVTVTAVASLIPVMGRARAVRRVLSGTPL